MMGEWMGGGRVYPTSRPIFSLCFVYMDVNKLSTRGLVEGGDNKIQAFGTL